MDDFLEEVSREEWGALPPKHTEEIIYPVQYIRFQYTGPHVFCKNREECMPLLRKMQKEHMEELGLPDIKFNFLIGVDGVVYECRGWKHDAYDPVKHVEMWRQSFVNIGFFGDYPKKLPLPMKAERAGLTVVMRMKEQGLIHDDTIPLWYSLGNKDFSYY